MLLPVCFFFMNLTFESELAKKTIIYLVLQIFMVGVKVLRCNKHACMFYTLCNFFYFNDTACGQYLFSKPWQHLLKHSTVMLASFLIASH